MGSSHKWQTKLCTTKWWEKINIYMTWLKISDASYGRESNEGDKYFSTHHFPNPAKRWEVQKEIFWGSKFKPMCKPPRKYGNTFSYKVIINGNRTIKTEKVSKMQTGLVFNFGPFYCYHSCVWFPWIGVKSWELAKLCKIGRYNDRMWTFVLWCKKCKILGSFVLFESTKGLTSCICLLTTIVERNLGKGQFGNLEASTNW